MVQLASHGCAQAALCSLSHASEQRRWPSDAGLQRIYSASGWPQVASPKATLQWRIARNPTRVRYLEPESACPVRPVGDSQLPCCISLAWRLQNELDQLGLLQNGASQLFLTGLVSPLSLRLLVAVEVGKRPALPSSPPTEADGRNLPGSGCPGSALKILVAPRREGFPRPGTFHGFDPGQSGAPQHRCSDAVPFRINMSVLMESASLNAGNLALGGK